MNIIQRVVLYQFSLMLVLLIVTSGCQTVNNTITPEPSVASLQSDSSQVDTERRTPQTSPAEKETTATEKSTNKVTGKSDIEKRSSAEVQKNLISRWSGLMGHGGMPQGSSAAEETTTTGQSDEIKKGPFVELEKNVVGKWLNLKETESIEFLNDGTIVIIDKRGVNPKLRGNYKFVDEGRLRVYFKGGLYARSMPPMSFKISISENEITLTDEPDGTATTYKRIK
ncbi:MAG: hypothetical protein JYX80_06850 [Candidatus Scalindua sediminis]|nr:hypothetical protein [Candidatus Scalindua sediminis]